jgi:hypothetical protein
MENFRSDLKVRQFEALCTLVFIGIELDAAFNHKVLDP